jgi:3-methyladenine DNA glycosylase AlkD
MYCTPNIYAQVLHFIKAQRNGETANLMTKMGLQYNINYGLSIIHIRQYAKELGRNHHVAKQLWKEDIRETKLFALYLFEPQEFSIDEINKLVLQLNNTELAEQAAFSVLTEADIPQATLMQWCQNASQTVKLTAYNTINRKFKTGNMAEFDFGVFFDMLEQEIAQDNILPTKSITFALSEIARKGHKNLIEEFLKKLETINTKQCTFIVECTKNELEYL